MPEEQETERIGPPEVTKRITDTLWEIPQSYKQGMRVPARIVASKKILDEMDMQVYEQASNVAMLPGIQKAAFVMPDGHYGYGFPIGGVAAFDVNDGGVISPGGIGFDINCLARNSKILTEYGYTRYIQDFEVDFSGVDVPYGSYLIKSQKCLTSVVSFDMDHNLFSSKNIIYFMKKKHQGSIFQIKTRLGYAVEVTDDHPILTERGMVKAGNLSKEGKMAVCPFEGVSYEEPKDFFIVSDEDLFSKQEREELIKRSLFPLNIRNPKVPIITKLFGYLLGDGQIYISGKKGFVCAYGQEEDLKMMQNDFEKLGFSAKIYSRERDHSIPTKYGKVEFRSTNFELHVSSKSLAQLFYVLGYPRGIKTSVQFFVPDWVMSGPLWIKRLFLSGLFGAELSKPKTYTKTGFYCPTFQMNKNSFLLENARHFFIQIMSLLHNFGVKTHKLVDFEDFKNKQGKTHTIRLLISAEENNLLQLFTRIGFSYNKKRDILSNIGVLYIKEKKFLARIRNETVLKIKDLRKQGLKLKEVQNLLESSFVNKRFIQRHYYEDASQRITLKFPSFDYFVDLKKKELETYGCFFDVIESVTKKDYNDDVYDFNIPETHTFIANNIIVSNCGMRLILTNLTIDQVKPHMKTLVDKLFQQIPAGVGGTGFVKLTKDQFKQVLAEGAHWAVPQGYGWDEDLERTELNGRADWAEVTKVSQKAIDRGYNQIGTLGSGNHYLEIQHVKKENIHDAKLAKKWGIFPGQVVVMFHTGSRGEGHQIATDYLRVFLDVMEKKYTIKIMDRELACAPFNSPEGQEYYKAMACAVNFSFANRQTILQRLRDVFSDVFKQDAESLGMKQVFDIAHNRATLEKHEVDGEMKELLVHRKGATASYYPGRKEIPKLYREDGSPVIIGGSMETGSYLLVGAEGAKETFCSTAHGSGRTMSRNQAKRTWRGDELQKDMEKRGIYVRTTSFSGLAEEAGAAYKDVHSVVEACEKAGISKRVTALVPLGNVKG